MRLLVVEDENAVAEPLTAALTCLDASYDISCAATLERAVAFVESEHFDAALVDLTLPDASDCDVAHALHRTCPDLPIVALTGRDFESVGLALARAGAQDYLRKGIASTERIHQSLQLAVERQRQKVMLQRKACYDDLTGVMNRSEVEIQLEKAISHAVRNGRLGAVLVVDIDDFKGINDTLGHHAGDVVLQEIAARMIARVRAGDSVGRLGGDEFVVVLEGLRDARHAKLVGKKVLDGCCCSINVGTRRVAVTASIGISIFPTEGTSTADLLHLADRGMYRSKRRGKAAMNGSDTRAGFSTLRAVRWLLRYVPFGIGRVPIAVGGTQMGVVSSPSQTGVARARTAHEMPAEREEGDRYDDPAEGTDRSNDGLHRHSALLSRY